MSGDIVFLDTETLGLDKRAPIWELAAIRRTEDGAESQLHMFIRHSSHGWLDDLPDEFRDDYEARYDPTQALDPRFAADTIWNFLRDRPNIVGAVPNFDTERVDRFLERYGLCAPWHYHLIDVETLAMGYLNGVAARAVDEARLRGETPLRMWRDRRAKNRPPWKSDELSRAIGVDPDGFTRHTALGDVLWVRAQYDAITGGRTA